MNKEQESKRFYWIKLKTDFYSDDNGAVAFLLGQPNGANYVVIYQMLCLMSANKNGELAYNVGEIIVPYDIDKIARECKYFSRDTIITALNLYKQLGLIYQSQDGMLVVSNVEEMVGSETEWAQKKRLQRERSRARELPENIVDNVDDSEDNYDDGERDNAEDIEEDNEVDNNKDIGGDNRGDNERTLSDKRLEIRDKRLEIRDKSIDMQVSKKVSKKEKDNNKTPCACAHARDSYEDIFKEFGVSNAVKTKFYEFIQHVLANGKVLINSRLEDMIIKLDRFYDDDAGKISEIDKAIKGGYMKLSIE